MAVFELYFTDLTEQAQAEFLRKAGLQSAKEGNYDVFPITEIVVGDDEDDEDEDDD